MKRIQPVTFPGVRLSSSPSMKFEYGRQAIGLGIDCPGPCTRRVGDMKNTGRGSQVSAAVLATCTARDSTFSPPPFVRVMAITGQTWFMEVLHDPPHLFRHRG